MFKSYAPLMPNETEGYLLAPDTPDDNDIELVFGGDLHRDTALYTNNGQDNLISRRRPSIESSNSIDNVNYRKSDLFRDLNLLYGWKCISGNILQMFNKPLCFLIILCLAGAAQGLIRTGITFTVLTSIERQFGFKSSELAVFSVIYDITYGICTIFVGYIGHKHKPRYIGWGVLLIALGAATSAIPKFIHGPYVAGVEQSSDFCRLSGSPLSKERCRESSKEWYYQFIFILGNILLGIGATPLYTLGPAHLDEVTERGQGSLYLGIFYSFAAVGPAMGFMIGMPVLNTYVDIKQPSNSTLTPSDTNWVGAWWLGYLIGACLSLIPVIPMLGFPSKFSNTEALRLKKLELEDTVEEDTNLKHDLKSVWPATKALLTNCPFVMVCVAIACEGIATGGFGTFLPKFVETQFHFTASNSALYTGIIVIPGAAGGIFCGGYLGKRFGWNCKETLRFAGLMALLATLCTTFVFVGCDGRTVVGQHKYNGTSFVSNCNMGCHCSTEFYKPICTQDDQQMYYSPCFAGCKKSNVIGSKFYNCSCFASNVYHAIDGACPSRCNLFPFFVIGAFLLMLFTFMNNVPLLNVLFRFVNDGQGSFAMGFHQVTVRFLAFIPAPIIFGHVIDKSCKLWQRDQCSKETTSCLEYNNAHFRYYMFGLCVVFKALSFVFITIAYKTYRLPEKRSQDENDNIT